MKIIHSGIYAEQQKTVYAFKVNIISLFLRTVFRREVLQAFLPAMGYSECAFNVQDHCMTADSRIVETADGYVIINTAKRPKDGCYCYVSTPDGTDFVHCVRGKLITRDGVVIRGEELDDVTVLGVVTFQCIRVHDDARAV